MDTHDQLLLSEQRVYANSWASPPIISYHPEVQAWRGGRKQSPSGQKEGAKDKEAKASTVQEKLFQSVQIPPNQAVVVRFNLTACIVDLNPYYWSEAHRLKQLLVSK